MSPRWGIVSAGKISHDFVTAVNSLPGNKVQVAAVAARDASKANDFAKLHNIKLVFQSYEDMAKSKDIDVAYIGALNHCHYPLSKLFLENGKHVVCEKPLCLNQKQVKSLVDLARKNKLFLMEAVWSRFLPSYLALEKELQSGKLGEIHFVEANFGIPIAGKERIANRDVGGGTILDIGIYVLQFAQYVFKDEPIKVTTSGSVGPTGTDESASIILDYSGGRRASLNVHGWVSMDNFATVVGTKGSVKFAQYVFKDEPIKVTTSGSVGPTGTDESASIILDYSGGRRASLNVHGWVSMDNFATVVGTKGSVKLLHPFHCTERLQTGEGVQEYPLHKSSIPFNFINSGGLAYQAQEVDRCIENGLLESPRMSHADSLLLAKLEDTIRAQIGVHFDVDDQSF